MNYPPCLDELETIRVALSGRVKGLCRYGDGCFGLMRGQRDVYHDPDPKLAYALAERLASPAKGVLNCLPRPVKEAESLYWYRWVAFLEANAGLVPLLGTQTYGSSYISRMDSAPACHHEWYWVTVAALWKDQDITLVRGSTRSLTSEMLTGSPSPPASVKEIETSWKNAWRMYDEVFDRVQRAGNEIVVLSTGTLARPLTHRLVEAGFRAWDLGHLGLYFDHGKPKLLSECR